MHRDMPERWARFLAFLSESQPPAVQSVAGTNTSSVALASDDTQIVASSLPLASATGDTRRKA